MNILNLKNLKRVFNFSGGRTSGMMTLMCDPQPDDIILFTDTGREHPGTYEFIRDFVYHEKLTVHIAQYEHIKSPGLTGFDALTNRKTYLPNRQKRLCTDELKVKTSKRYLRKEMNLQRFENYIGFRSDEEHRVKGYKQRYVKVIPQFPLYKMGVDHEQVMDFWSKKPYDLKIPRILGNCDLCFLKGKNAIIRILQHYPELAEKWIKDENRNGRKSTYIKGTTYAELLEIARTRPTLFDKDGLEEIQPAFNCQCNAL